MNDNQRKVLASRIELLGNSLSAGSASVAVALSVNDGQFLTSNLSLVLPLLVFSACAFLVTTLLLLELAD